MYVPSSDPRQYQFLCMYAYTCTCTVLYMYIHSSYIAWRGMYGCVSAHTCLSRLAAGFCSAFKISSCSTETSCCGNLVYSSVFESSLSLSAVHHVHVCVTLAHEKPRVSVPLSKYRRCFTETSCRGYLVFNSSVEPLSL